MNIEEEPKLKKCFFTGHRNMSISEIMSIQDELEQCISDCIAAGVYIFIAGGAVGFDTLAAETVLKLKRKYPDIMLCLYIPGYGQTRCFSASQKRRWKYIWNRADYVKYISYADCGIKGVYAKRNQAMADDAGFCIAYCKYERTGSAQTLEMAKKNGVIIMNIG